MEYQLNQQQFEDIKKAIAEADAGDFAADEQVKAMFAKMRGRAPRKRKTNRICGKA